MTHSIRKYFLLGFVSLFLSCGGADDGPITPTPPIDDDDPITGPTYTNPLLGLDFPDPTVIKGGDGFFYAYATNTNRGGWINIQVAKSSDLINWTFVGDALPNKPSWATQDFWAPHVTYDSGTGKYYMYYSGKSPETNIDKCIGVAVSNSPTGPFVDSGSPLVSGSGFVNIDPMAYKDPATGKKYLYWGSGFESIRVRELNDDWLSFKENAEVTYLIPTNPGNGDENYEDLVEGAWVVKKDNFYYLYYSGENCCEGTAPRYAVMVARATSPTGPFEKYVNSNNSPVILQRNADWLAPGHNSVIEDNNGDHWMFYHAFRTTNRALGRVMLTDKITYTNGWPSIESSQPSSQPKAAPVVN